MRKSTTVPMEGDRVDVRALKALAYARGLTMAQLVRNAIDLYCGEELQDLRIFFTSDGTQKVHAAHKSDA